MAIVTNVWGFRGTESFGGQDARLRRISPSPVSPSPAAAGAGRKLCREGQDSFVSQVGGVRQGRLNARHRERRIALDDLLGRQPVCQVSKNHGNGNSRAANACLAVEHCRIHGDVLAPVHIAIVANVCGLLGTDSRGGRDA
jgi:hypothetical protein